MTRISRAYGESRMGVAAGKRNFVYISASDGVGAGIVINGEIMHGVTGLAGEIGHIQVDPLGAICSCGNRGCLGHRRGGKQAWCSCSASHTAI